MSLRQQKMCEGCGLKRPHYGLPAERRVRWCAGCAAAEGRGGGEPGSEDVRGLRPQASELRAADRAEGAVVLRLRQGPCGCVLELGGYTLRSVAIPAATY